MARVLITTSAALGLFFRLGRAFTKAGEVFDQGDFTEDQWAVLAKEPLLHIAAAPTEADTAKADEDKLAKALKAAFGKLAKEDFDADGLPLSEAMHRLLPTWAKGTSPEVIALAWSSLKSKAGADKAPA